MICRVSHIAPRAPVGYRVRNMVASIGIRALVGAQHSLLSHATPQPHSNPQPFSPAQTSPFTPWAALPTISRRKPTLAERPKPQQLRTAAGSCGQSRGPDPTPPGPRKPEKCSLPRPNSLSPWTPESQEPIDGFSTRVKSGAYAWFKRASWTADVVGSSPSNCGDNRRRRHIAIAVAPVGAGSTRDLSPVPATTYLRTTFAPTVARVSATYKARCVRGLTGPTLGLCTSTV